MALYHFHRVLIAAAVLFFFGYGLFALHQGGSVNVAMGAAALAATAGLVAYLIYFNYRVLMKGHEPGRRLEA